jgi:peptidoglycan hydrolase CwlO-like protein
MLQDYQQAQANLAALEHSAETDLAVLTEKEKQLRSLTGASDKKLARANRVLTKLTADQRRKIADANQRAAARANAAGAAASRDAARTSVSASGKRSRSRRLSSENPTYAMGPGRTAGTAQD